LQSPATETVYRVVLGFDEFSIHSYFQQLCFGSYEGVEIAKDLVEVLSRSKVKFSVSEQPVFQELAHGETGSIVPEQ